MVIFYHSSVVRSNTASFIQHCLCCKGGKRKSVCVCISVWNDKALSRFTLQNNQNHGSRERGERKAALREINFPCTTVFLLGYMDRLQSYWAGEGILHRAQDIPSWTFPERSLTSLTYSTFSNRASAELELGLCDQVTAARAVPWHGQWLLPS